MMETLNVLADIVVVDVVKVVVAVLVDATCQREVETWSTRRFEGRLDSTGRTGGHDVGWDDAMLQS